MENANKVSLNRIIGNVIGNLRIKNTNDIHDDFARWACEAVNKIGSKQSYRRFECELNIRNRKAPLPPNFVYLNAVKYGNKILPVTKRSFRLFNKGEDTNNLANANVAKLNTGINAQGSSGSITGYSYNYDIAPSDQVFSIDNGCINFNVNDDERIGISYMGIDLDEEGWPLIAEVHEDAVTHYVMYMYKAADYWAGKMNRGTYKDLETRWFDLCGQARGDDEMPNSEEMKYLSSMWMQLIPPPSKENF